MIERFTDGGMADVVRIGDEVHKQRGPWWDATRQVLQYLEQSGYSLSPRVQGESETTVELSYIEGETIPAGLDESVDNEFLQRLGVELRELHDTLSGFRLDHGTECVPWPILPPGANILCHNDVSPWNTVVRHRDISGFIDWDLVSYATREWELAWMCWRWAPIYPFAEPTPANAEIQAERCCTLLRAYGLDALDLTDFVSLIDRRMECSLEAVEQLGAQGVPGFDRLLANGAHLGGHDERAWLAGNVDVFRRAVESLQ